MDGRDKGRTRIFGPAPSRKTLEIKSSRLYFVYPGNDCTTDNNRRIEITTNTKIIQGAPDNVLLLFSVTTPAFSKMFISHHLGYVSIMCSKHRIEVELLIINFYVHIKIH